MQETILFLYNDKNHSLRLRFTFLKWMQNMLTTMIYRSYKKLDIPVICPENRREGVNGTVYNQLLKVRNRNIKIFDLKFYANRKKNG